MSRTVVNFALGWVLLQIAAVHAADPAAPFVYVCRDAGAGGYQAFPDVCRLQDGRLMAVFLAGYGHISLPKAQWPKGGRIAYCISSDEGHSWSKAETLIDTPYDDRDPSLVQLKDGRVLCTFFCLQKGTKPGQDYDFLGTWMIVSSDLGKTWSEPRKVYQDHACTSPIRELSDGRLVMPLYRETDETAVGAVGISDDGGKTWSKPIVIPNGGHRLDAETDVIELKDGTLYAAQRPVMCFSISKDRGNTWTVSKPIGFAGHAPYLHRTRDGIVLMAYRIPATNLRYSLDECKTWSKDVPVDTVWGAYPSMANLKDGSVLIVYYEEGDRSGIRAKRFRATPNGIQWLVP
jgi:hypothetical protein